ARFSEVARFGFPASVWRHFERLQSFPRGLLPFGDAICRFNPVWGQGMTVAAQEAILLRRLLGASGGDARALVDLVPAFFTEARSMIESPWRQAAVPDFVMPETEGERPPDFENQLRFGGALALDDFIDDRHRFSSGTWPWHPYPHGVPTLRRGARSR